MEPEDVERRCRCTWCHELVHEDSIHVLSAVYDADDLWAYVCSGCLLALETAQEKGA